jgi:predicted Zn-dependent protease
MQTAYPSHGSYFNAKRSGSKATLRVFASIFLFILMIVAQSACISAPPKKVTALEQAQEENTVGGALAKPFEAKIRYKTDPVVNRYLSLLAEMISSASGDVRLNGVGIAIIQDINGQWRNYSLPGRKIYISVGMLKQLKYDNEVAALIALEFGNIVQRHALNHLKKQFPNQVSGTGTPSNIQPAQVDYFGENGLFSFDVEEFKLSVSAAIDLLYRSGFDNRGLLHVWSVLEENPEHSPFPEKVLEELSGYTRDILSKYAPLRNPVVSTQSFSIIRKRIQNL